jgi:predicted AAA+ superfamily ATPase
MNILLEQSARLLAYTDVSFKRFLSQKINWNERLIGIKGARGVGKTTLVLQHLKGFSAPASSVAYFSLDDLYFAGHTLRETADSFYKQGGRVLALDEVHKYPGWSAEIKNLYDFYPDLQILFTGSSIIDIAKEEGDLSRRALLYDLPGLSFREYLSMKGIINLPAIELNQLLNGSISYSELLHGGFRPFEYFNDYLKYGYYPFGIQNPASNYQRLNQVIRTIIETDMAELITFDIRNARKMFQLIEVIAGQVPFKPNIKELAEKTQIHRNSMNAYLHYLEKAKIISLLYPAGKSTAVLQKPEKIYLQNTSLLYALVNENVESGNVRETFFHSMLSVNHKINAPLQGDFLIDNKFTFEVGGKTKKKVQIENINNAWVVKDGIEIASTNVLPIWTIGLLY